MSDLTIGKAAVRAGVGIATLRFYERRGLIDQPPKPAHGYRIYPAETVERIRFIRQAQEIGFSLQEIAELLSLRADPDADCADVRARAIGKRDEVLARLERLQRIRDALEALIARCPGGGENVACCTILDAMDGSTGAASSASYGAGITAEQGEPEMKTTTMTIKGMHCDGCARTVEALLLRVPGVRKAEASFDKREARVLHDRNKAPEADLAAAIARGGFEAAVKRP